jgi:3',5'-cyclic AMP phosphodiesterase CpdA
MKFIHISDLHFHRDQNDNKEANQALETIKSRYPDHILIVTGDITDDGHELQYENAFKALEPFAGRIFIAPGNHDFGAAGNFYSRERALRFDEMLSKPFKQGGTFTGDATPVVNIVGEAGDRIMLIALDTNLETDQPFDFACGEVGSTQLAFLESLLNAPSSGEMQKLLFFHHHPFMHGNPFMELKDARELMRTVYHKIDVLLFGHKHVAGRWDNVNGIQYILASDNTPGKDYVREISIEDMKIDVNELSIKPGQKNKKRKKNIKN